MAPAVAQVSFVVRVNTSVASFTLLHGDRTRPWKPSPLATIPRRGRSFPAGAPETASDTGEATKRAATRVIGFLSLSTGASGQLSCGWTH